MLSVIIPKIACVPKYNIRHIRTFKCAIRYPSRYAKLTSAVLISTTLVNIYVYLDEPLQNIVCITVCITVCIVIYSAIYCAIIMGIIYLLCTTGSYIYSTAVTLKKIHDYTND